MANDVKTHLMFEGDAEAAMELYVSLFRDAEILDIERLGADAGDFEGKVQLATFAICGRRFQCADSPVEHDFGFTPSMSLFVDCDDETELEELFEKLSEGGEVMMPLDDYGFSTRFGWCSDRYGVSWQLNLP
jgi:predicted 3-demethylubiquinone-9 3-methyltransferase (glyoxalase superfamily)